MAARDATGLVYGCLTHVPLWLEFPSFVTPIYLGQAQNPGQFNLRELAPEWEPHHPVLGGTAGSFALKNYVLKHRPDATRIGVCQYRKFVSPRRISRLAAPRYRSMDLVSKHLLTPDVFARELHPGVREFLVCGPWSFGQHWKRSRRKTYVEEYVESHHIEDLLRFTAVAVELGIIAKTDVWSFFEEDNIIPGGVELGVYPAPFWLHCIAGLESVARECVRTFPAARPGYQARSWAFCAERLGSFFLLRHFGALGDHRLRLRRLSRVLPPAWMKRNAGQLNLIVEDDVADYIPGK